MKKIILMIAAVTLILNNSSAQETDYREKLSFGLKIGTNYSNVYDAEGEAYHADPKLGLAGGVFLAIPIGKYFGLQPEVLYSEKGYQSSGSFLGSTYNYTQTTTYIDVPLLFSLKPSEFFTLLAGPQYSYLLNKKTVFTSGSTSLEQENEYDNDNIRKNTLCFTGGADITIKHFVIGARAGWDLQNNNGDGSSTTPRYKNMWYQGSIGFRF